MGSGVYVRAKTADGRFASVDVLDLDDRSYRLFVLDFMMKQSHMRGLPPETLNYSTGLTLALVEERG